MGLLKCCMGDTGLLVAQTFADRASSLNKFKKTFGRRVGKQYVLHPKQLKVEGERVYLPLYMAFCL